MRRRAAGRAQADRLYAAAREDYLRAGTLPSFDDALGAARVTGIAIVLVFLLLAGLMVARKMPALLAVPLMAIAMAAIAGNSPGAVADVIVKGAVQLAPVYATVIFGALLSRVVLSTGIAETIVTYAAEYGGDRPIVLALILCAAVALLFTSVTGLGAIIMIGTIVLPVMMTVGVPRVTAATLFLLAFGLGYILNIAQWKFYRDVFGVDQIAAAKLHLLAVRDRRAGVDRLRADSFARDARLTRRSRWPGRRRANAPGAWALLTPVLPLVLYAGLHVDALVAFLIAALYRRAVTQPREIAATLSAAWIRGVEDVAPAVILMMGIGMLLVAAKTPAVQAAVTPVIAALAPRTPLAYVIVFGLLSPLALYRGPLNPFGVGIGVYTVLATLHVLPPVALVAAVMAVVQVQNVCDPTNTQNVWVANFTGVGVEAHHAARAALSGRRRDARRRVRRGVRTRAVRRRRRSRRAAAAAATVPLGAPAGEQRRRRGRRRIAAAERRGAADRGGDRARLEPVSRLRAPAVDATAHACAARAVCERHARVGRSQSAPSTTSGSSCSIAPAGTSISGTSRATTCACARWARSMRVREWMTSSVPRSRPTCSAAASPFDPARPAATYFFMLFKTNDGVMHALVRPGGPAWQAGLRMDDVVDKVDGRWWWEYGTFQTQAARVRRTTAHVRGVARRRARHPRRARRALSRRGARRES